jgi:hypothetical protein
MSTELCEFVQLVLARMDTNPEEFIEGDPKHRWGALSRGLIDWAMEQTDTSSARTLWALEPHEREALTTKYKAIYLEKEKRAFLKNILGGNEIQSKKVQVVKKPGPLTASQITNEALSILREEWKAVDPRHITDSGAYANGALNISGQHARNTLPDSNTNQYQYGWRDPRGTDEPNNT